MPGTPTLPALAEFNVRGESGAPLVREYTKDPSSALTIRRGDFVKQVAGGLIQRATPADTALLGISLDYEDYSAYVAREIPLPPNILDSSGRPKLRIAVASPLNTFTGVASGTATQSIVAKTCDLQHRLASPTPTVTPQGTTGATTHNYKIVALNIVGKAVAGSTGQTTSGNATLDGTNFNRVTWASVVDATAYEIWYDIGSSVFSYIGIVYAGSTLQFDDKGSTLVPRLGGTISAVANSGWFINPGATSTVVVQIQKIIQLPNRGVGSALATVEFQIPAGKSQFLGVSGS